MSVIGRACALISLAAIFCVVVDTGDAQPQTSAPTAETPKKAATSAGKTAATATSATGATAKKPATSAAAAPAKPADPNVVACHALEAHTNLQPAVTIVVFNQKERPDHDRLSDLLKENEGASVEIKTGDGKWHNAAVARLKSCFGRGLLSSPAILKRSKSTTILSCGFPLRKLPELS